MSFSIPELVTMVNADFSARSVAAEVLFGAWKVQLHNGANRVIFGLGGFVYAPPGAQNAPGPQDLGDGTMARSLMTRVQSCAVWVHAKPPSNPDPRGRAEDAQRATAALLDATLAALYRIAAGSFAWGNGTWPNETVQEFVYGSLAQFEAQFSIPVLDDAIPIVFPDPTTSTTSTYIALPSGNVLANQSP